MLRLNKKIEYGIIALLYLDNREDKVASVREMAESCSIPETLLSKIMQSMKNKGYVNAQYGNQGGYKLTQDLSKISLLDVNNTLVGPVQVTECLEPGNADCPVKTNCSILTPMALLNQKIIELLQQTSIQALAHRGKNESADLSR